MAKNDEQENNVLQLNPAELYEKAEEEEAEHFWTYEPEKKLTPEAVLADFHIMAHIMQDVAEGGPDWESWDNWTEEQARTLLRFVDCIGWHNENIRLTLALIGIKEEED